MQTRQAKKLSNIIMKNLIVLIVCFPILLLGQGWEKTYENGVGFSVQQTSDGGYVITGYTYNSNNESRDIYLIKTDSYGDTLWIRTYGDSFTDVGHSVQQTIDGGYVIAGSTDLDNSGTNADICLIKTDSNGDIEWTKNYGGDYFDIGQSVQQTLDGGYIITGRKNNGNEDYIILIKTNESGIITSTTEIPISFTSRKLVRKVDLFGREILNPPKNKPYIEIYDDGTTQKKMRTE
jgi:hypothetical protein